MYFGFFFTTFILAVIITPVIHIVMKKLGIIDRPKTEARKIHKKPVPLGGGWVIFISFFLGLLIAATSTRIFGHDIAQKNLVGLFIGSLILMIGGLLDDKYNLKPKFQIIFPVIAALIILIFGVGPHQFTNPTGGIFDFSKFKISIDGLGSWFVVADTIVFFWLMGMMFTTKFLDGLDGLVAGIVTIGAIIIYFLSRQPQWYQPEVAMVSIIFAGACLGFLVWNWHPAKIFLGQGGSLVTGYILGVLAIISGGKVATTLLVMGIPALDVIRVIIRRIKNKKSIFEGDSEHLHYKLVNSGLSQRQAVALLYGISLIFGVSALFLHSSHKLIAFVVLLVVMAAVGVWMAKAKSKKDNYASIYGGRKNSYQ